MTGPVAAGKSWIWGNVYAYGGENERAEGKFFPSSRPRSLLDHTGSYFTLEPPTYQEYGVSRVVNVKNVTGLPVAGDGVKDE